MRSIGVPRSYPQFGSTGVVRRRTPRSSGWLRFQSRYAASTGRARCRTGSGTNRRQPNKAAMIVAVRGPSPDERIVVVSPHLDDGVLSLGASIARWSRAGAAVELLTVLGCDPASAAQAGGWDRRGGFATEGESALARREEDRR